MALFPVRDRGPDPPPVAARAEGHRRGLPQGLRRHPHRHAPPALEGRRLQGPRPARRRRGAALRRRPQGEDQAAQGHDRRPDPDGDAHPADAQHVALGPARHLAHRDAAARPAGRPHGRDALQRQAHRRGRPPGARPGRPGLRHPQPHRGHRQGRRARHQARAPGPGRRRPRPDDRSGQLEKRMLDFVERKYDVLVSTTIVENGIDIPLVNTLIVDRADLYGLAQLYQLRGRVGRSARQAYAYFLVPPYIELTPLARERLKALKEFSELGSGFRLAARDLEIRGAGNLLGHRQHGHDGGRRLRVLHAAARPGHPRAQGRGRSRRTTPRSTSRSTSASPRTTCPRSTSGSTSTSAWPRSRTWPRSTASARRSVDRFGPVPEPIENLLRYGALKHLAKKLRLRSVDRTEHRVVFKFRPETPVDWSRVTPLLKKRSGSLSPEGSCRSPCRGTTEQDPPR
ncbi:MAG: hypothetical protein MZV64_50075 [Ignavibacteriales bacterium]|nr:hypothetical protein [Ignavibacteriales bacterium]